ncbi:hypothetical protein GCM10028803_03370 [Larkinella knui]|uniref:DUF481 domain-containing protein n=1 Tax=Larkinella knui TaxID=2025310 RepID=A0A3P1CKW8_9BACT|nr:hypothetical protein [Larkinella knui]RRB13972.1 hypothetical protein EHT87_17120 [Larkinella knui]
MKTALTTFWLSLIISPAFSQGMTDYYRPPVETVGDDQPEWRSTRTRRTELTQLVARYGEAYIRERWYVGGDGFFRTDQSQLDQTFNGLISTKATIRTGWSALVGWVGNERWALEGGYARSAIHNTLVVGSGSNALDLRFENNKNGYVIRGKRLLRFGNRAARRSGVWLGAGLWMIPNNGRQLSSFLVEGYTYSGSGGGYRRQPNRTQIDTIQIFGETRLSPNVSGLAEASAEYTVKLGGRAELSFFARKYWGLDPSITTNLMYSVNHGASQAAVLRSDGSGWSVGVSLRYVYALRYDLRKMPGIFNLRGNRPESAPAKRRSNQL